ncbi:hypothetical protein BKA61DRAFT_605732 [Leptodontidium sp. MPI-SDFR-AT-0119]|nr:hypothetical protein BKA61DRAFT_605732 [Leptodontidium sp. MPI-SDFR-AT-0119]
MSPPPTPSMSSSSLPNGTWRDPSMPPTPIVPSSLPNGTWRDPSMPPPPVSSMSSSQTTRPDILPESCNESAADWNLRGRVDRETLGDDASLHLLPSTAAPNAMESVPPGLESAEDAVPTPSSASRVVVLSQDSIYQLLYHFFTNVKLPISVLCEGKFYRQYKAGMIPSFLLDAMFSLSARFSSVPEIQELTAMGPGFVGSYFRCRAGAEMDRISGISGTFTPLDVTAAFLLAYHDLTDMPTLKAADQFSKVVRMACTAGFHQIGNESHIVQANDPLSQIALEEKRCLWWGIFMLGTFSSVGSLVLGNIEDGSMYSCLPSGLINEITPQAGLNPRQACLDGDWITFWNIVLHQQPLSGMAQTVLIYATAMAQKLVSIRWLVVENPSYNISPRLDSLRYMWNMLLSMVPTWFFDPARHASENTGDSHRKRLETLVMIHSLGSQSNGPPIDFCLRWPARNHQAPRTLENRLSDCVFHAQQIANIYTAWAPEYCGVPGPTMVPITSCAINVLILQTMNQDVIDMDKHALRGSIDTLMGHVRSSGHWNIAHIFTRSLENLRETSSWRKLDTQAIFQLLMSPSAPQVQWNTPRAIVAPEEDLSTGFEDRTVFPSPGFWMPTPDDSVTMVWPTFNAGNEHASSQA